MKQLIFKTRYLWASVISITIGILLVSILSSCETLPAKHTCLEIANSTAKVMVSQGYEVRRGFGWFRGTPHAWVEYKKGDEWLIRDDAIWYIGRGFTLEQHGDYKVKYYRYNKDK